MNPLLLISVKAVNVSNFPIETPIPISMYGATQGIGTLTLVFPPNSNAVDSAFSSVGLSLKSFFRLSLSI